jgi:hypothetical protein
MGDWNHFTITQTIPKQNTGKALNQRTTENSYIWHCTRAHTHTHTAESANVKVQNIFHGRINVINTVQTVNTEQLQHCVP